MSYLKDASRLPKLILEIVNYHGGFDAVFGNMGRIIAHPGFFYRCRGGRGGFFVAICPLKPRGIGSGLNTAPLGFEAAFTQWLLIN